jgi:hypothetical protein
VVASQGISRLGGDDFDAALLALALTRIEIEALKQVTLSARLLNLCRTAKEAINPNTRNVVLDFGQLQPDYEEVRIPIQEFYQRCEPLIQESIKATETAIAGAMGDSAGDMPGLASVYLVGGACELPVLARALRERFGKRVRRSLYPAAATAVGLAIAAEEEQRFVLQEQFNRHFGVWREDQSGRKVSFDVIFNRTTVLPHLGDPPLVVRRNYHPVHNIGHFRFLECTQLKNDAEPAGDIVYWDAILFPFHPNLSQDPELEKVGVATWPEAQSAWIEEVYRCDAAGLIEVTISNQTAGYSKTYQIRQAKA